jgi:hypothetical protein
MLRFWTIVATVLVAVGALFGVVDRGFAAEQDLCAYPQTTTANGRIATVSFRVVQDGCELSFVSIKKFADETQNFIWDAVPPKGSTAGQIFAKSDTPNTLSVELPCGDRASETDLMRGPPAYFPPGDLDLQATVFPPIACPADTGGGTGGGGTGGGGTGGGTGGGGTGGGGTGGGGTGGGGTGGGGGAGGAALPDLKTTITAPKTTGLKLGQTARVSITITNQGKAAAGGARALITLSDNSIPKGRATSSRGAGCTGVNLVSCDLGSLPPGASATIKLALAGASGRKMYVGARASANETDAAPNDDWGSLMLQIVPGQPARFTFGVTPRGIAAGAQIAYVKLSRNARVTAQFYVNGKPRPITWRRSLRAGTTIIRISLLPELKKGTHFSIVVRAVNGKKKASTTLRLVA